MVAADYAAKARPLAIKHEHKRSLFQGQTSPKKKKRPDVIWLEDREKRERTPPGQELQKRSQCILHKAKSLSLLFRFFGCQRVPGRAPAPVLFLTQGIKKRRGWKSSRENQRLPKKWKYHDRVFFRFFVAVGMGSRSFCRWSIPVPLLVTAIAAHSSIKTMT